MLLNDFKKYRNVIILSGIITAGLLLRLLTWHMEGTVARDGILYINMVNVWYDAGDYEIVLERFPGYRWVPVFILWIIKTLMKTGISAETVGVGISLVLGSLLPLIAYGIASVTCGKKEIALGAALLAAFHPILIEMSIEVLRETPYLFFAGIMIWSLLGAIKYHKWYLWCIGGVAGALAVMTRYETLELLFLTFGYLFLAPFMKWETRRRAYGFYLPCFICLFCLTVFAIYWLAEISPRNHAEQYYWRIKNGYVEMFRRNLLGND